MRLNLLRSLLGALILLLMLGHAGRWYPIPLLDHLEAIAYDARLRLTMPQAGDERVVVLDIDERSLAEVGRWPWGRDRLADLVDTLFTHYGVAVLGFDVVFAEPDESSGLPVLEALAAGPLRGDAGYRRAVEALRPRLDRDARFARALADRPVVLGFYLTDRADAGGGALPEPALAAADLPAGSAATRWRGYGGNLAAFQRAAGAAGHMNPLLDFDGVSRRVPMLACHEDGCYEALSLAIVRRLLGQPPLWPGAPEGGAATGMEWIDLPTETGMLRIPVDADAASLVPYLGRQGSFRYVSLADVLARRLPADALAGRIAIVGTSAPGLMDLRVTPVGTAYPGVEIHASLVAGLLDGGIKSRPAWVLGADVSQVLLLGGLMILALARLSPLRLTAATAAMLFLLVGANLAFWQLGGLVLPLAGALSAVLVLYALNMSWGYFVEARSKRQFTELFGQYVPPELVDEMARNPRNYSMEGRRAELSVLFSDVRGFTGIAEGMPPEELAALMNEYLGAMTAIIRAHRGTLDKYIGDAIMAFWGAPVAEAGHARQAVLAAIAMQRALPALNASLAARGRPALRIGIGINSGTVTVGDMGSPLRKAYTVMGDAVNLASRLEGVTKRYGVGVVVGEGTRALLGDDFVCRELDCVRVKGKDAPVAIFEPIGLAGEIAAARMAELADWRETLRAYRCQDWDAADAGLRRLAAALPEELVLLYRERIAHYRERPPGADWDGVWTFTSK